MKGYAALLNVNQPHGISTWKSVLDHQMVTALAPFVDANCHQPCN